MKKAFLFSVLVLVTALVIGCATLFNPKQADVNLSSEPQGAEVYVNGFNMGTTPVTLLLEKKKTHTIEFKKDGFETRVYVINNHVGIGYVVLDIVAGLVPIVVDAITGDWYQLNETDVRVVLGGSSEGQKTSAKKTTTKK